MFWCNDIGYHLISSLQHWPFNFNLQYLKCQKTHNNRFYILREASRSPTKRSLSNLVNGSTEIGQAALGGSYKNDDDFILAFPKRVNIYGSIFIIIYVVFFNIGYWWICIHEYLQPAENYITASNNTST